MEQIFRIRQWKSGGIVLKTHFVEYNKNNRFVIDSERTFNKKLKQLKQRADRLNGEYVRYAITAEKYVNGVWDLLEQYPADISLPIEKGNK